MKLEKYIFVDRDGDIVENGDSITDYEENGVVAIKLEGEIPDILFEPIELKMTLDIPKDAGVDPESVFKWLAGNHKKKANAS